MAFNPNEHIIELEQSKKNRITGRWETVKVRYLPVAARILWMRTEHPDWAIRTQALIEPATALQEGVAIFKAAIVDEKDKVLATATKMESKENFTDFIEKAETGAIGRALALVGYGTQFAPELSEEERVVDAPLPKKESPEEFINRLRKKEF
jgi:hypothetical protein